ERHASGYIFHLVPVWGCDIDDSEDGEDIVKEDVPPFTSAKTKEPSASSSPRSIQLRELTNAVLLLQSQKNKLEAEKNISEAEIAQLKAQPSFPDLGQFNELLIQSLKNELTKILSTHDFSSSLPTKLKDIPSRFTKLTDEVQDLKNYIPNWRSSYQLN
ncbi:hypothetical protein Tco_1130303, partial [Tanacetum coccineum]